MLLSSPARACPARSRRDERRAGTVGTRMPHRKDAIDCCTRTAHAMQPRKPTSPPFALANWTNYKAAVPKRNHHISNGHRRLLCCVTIRTLPITPDWPAIGPSRPDITTPSVDQGNTVEHAGGRARGPVLGLRPRSRFHLAASARAPLLFLSIRTFGIMPIGQRAAGGSRPSPRGPRLSCSCS
ncbi:hypothetical protein CSOJ01_01180 [Colletotrichum sojae]|uniref:Uncharacterized protein n=1 Tax=Colletotrichum sojae TaxID=2175907 RepID=A0A8H6JW11_9PEZI|nr:hypothetical protein CSOJ01_01180 [Colletotrichum sojae]